MMTTEPATTRPEALQVAFSTSISTCFHTSSLMMTCFHTSSLMMTRKDLEVPNHNFEKYVVVCTHRGELIFEKPSGKGNFAALLLLELFYK
jgi:hypothetical protein